MLKHSLAIGLFIGMNALAHAAPEKSPWVQIYKDENGKTFVNTQVALAEKNQEQLKKFGYKYIYTYGVPSLKIAPIRLCAGCTYHQLCGSDPCLCDQSAL